MSVVIRIILATDVGFLLNLVLIFAGVYLVRPESFEITVGLPKFLSFTVKIGKPRTSP